MAPMMQLPSLQRLTGERIVEDDLPRVLPASWRREKDRLIFGCTVARYKQGPLLCLVSRSTDEETGEWVHVSISYANGPPSWSQIMECKDLFIGADREAIQVIPPRSDEVNIAHCWHIWARP